MTKVMIYKYRKLKPLHHMKDKILALSKWPVQENHSFFSEMNPHCVRSQTFQFNWSCLQICKVENIVSGNNGHLIFFKILGIVSICMFPSNFFVQLEIILQEIYSHWIILRLSMTCAFWQMLEFYLEVLILSQAKGLCLNLYYVKWAGNCSFNGSIHLTCDPLMHQTTRIARSRPQNCYSINYCATLRSYETAIKFWPETFEWVEWCSFDVRLIRWTM